MRQALVNGLGVALALKSKYSALGLSTHFCMMGGIMRPGTKAPFSKTLEAGTTYAFVGAGDDAPGDLDITVTDAYGSLVAHDSDDDASPFVAFTPTRTGTYTVRMSLASGPATYGAIISLQNRDGWDIPVENLGSVIGKLVVRGGSLNRQSPMNFAENNDWSVLASVVTGRSSERVDDIPLRGNHVVLGVADDNVTDLDLSMVVQGQTYRDFQRDDFPLLQGNWYGQGAFRIYNRSPKASLTAVAILQRG